MKTLVFGANGQLGRSLKDVQPDTRNVIYLTRDDCDLTQQNNIREVLEEFGPDVVINAAAYTAVDRAESEFEVAKAVNEIAVMAMAEYVVSNHAVLMHLSTDFVFEGTKKTPYLPGDQTAPLGVYAQTKLGGELVALKTAPESTMIIRTSWVYSEHGNNFVKTMLKLMSERDELNVVDDQIGSPTYARGLAEIIWQILDTDLFKPGIYHWTDDTSPLVLSDRGRARPEGPPDQAGITWYTFAKAIQEEAYSQGLLHTKVHINAIPSVGYPTPAERPAYSVLDSAKLANHLGLQTRSWGSQLSEMLKRLS